MDKLIEERLKEISSKTGISFEELKVKCKSCMNTAEFNHCYFNSECRTKEEFCKNHCRYIKKEIKNGK